MKPMPKKPRIIIAHLEGSLVASAFFPAREPSIHIDDFWRTPREAAELTVHSYGRWSSVTRFSVTPLDSIIQKTSRRCWWAWPRWKSGPISFMTEKYGQAQSQSVRLQGLRKMWS
jgi:hypothetical protein